MSKKMARASLSFMMSRDDGTLNERRLVKAAAIGDIKTVTALLEAGVNVDADELNKSLFYASRNYVTPLQRACYCNYVCCADLLIAHGADVNAKDRFDVTAMHMAAQRGHISCLKALLNANAECSIPTKFSKTGSYTAVPHPGGTTPLHLAAANNHVECVKELIQYGADYNAVDERGRTSLYVAAQYGHSDCVLAHLKNAVGRDILALPSYETGDTPLHFAVSLGMIECIEELLKSGSDVNHLNYKGYSPLHFAVSPNNDSESLSFQILQMLVLKGYNTNISQCDGEDLTPLHYVSFSGGKCFRRPEMIKFLISHGADVHINNARGLSLLECELSSSSEDIEILGYIVRSLLHLPHLTKLRVVSHLPYTVPYRSHISGLVVSNNELVVWKAMALHGSSPPSVTVRLPGPPSTRVSEENLNLDNKHIWYETIASNPRTLQHYCRYAIRKALGPPSMKYIKRLPIPVTLQSYLSLEYGE